VAGPALAHVYRYPGESRAGAGELRLVTSGGVDEHPLFFVGELVQPRLTAMLLRELSRVVGARYFVPPSMLQSILRQADPVVTSGGGMLRFEGFSACASAYARVDLSPEAYAGDVVSSGTTNVDFNAPMRAALASVHDAQRVRFSVGVDRVVLEKEGAAIVEKKVALPMRWLKGLVEVQAYQARMRKYLELPAADAVRFLRALPRAGSKHEHYVVPAGRGARLSMTRVEGALRVSGTERLRVLEEITPRARVLRAFGDENGQASAWELDFGGSRFTLVLSGEVWRGFSGEGQALSALTADSPILSRMRAELRWQSELGPDALARVLEASREEVHRALLWLGARGLVGFDLGPHAFFHRELPFDLELIEAMQPRLAAAKKLVAAGGIVVSGEEALVPGSDVTHRVRGDRCTCPWFAKHLGARGPCKHVLAVQLLNEKDDP